MNVLILGSGGREHALGWKIAQSKMLTKLYVAPGNAGTAGIATNLPLNPNDFDAVASLVREFNIQLLVVGPEEPLVRGIRDFLSAQPDLKHLMMIGPDAAGAMLEGSKDFAKEFMVQYGIPTARYRSFTDMSAADYLHTEAGPYVLKADGLAAGKGVVILEDAEEAIRELGAMFSGKFGSAGKTVVIEEFLSGIELSVFILTDGNHYLMLPEAKDYKRIGEGDTGLNTGGMGAVSPVPFADDAFMNKVKTRIIEPTLLGLRERGIVYQGFIFFGLINVGGEPFVIEYNVRMGDPETEVVIPRIESDFLGHLLAAARGELGDEQIQISSKTATTVMLVSGGYPGDYEKGKNIHGLEKMQHELVFHAGTTLRDGEVLTSGGRVLAMTALGDDRHEALKQSYSNAAELNFEGLYFRKDIGFDLK